MPLLATLTTAFRPTVGLSLAELEEQIGAQPSLAKANSGSSLLPVPDVSNSHIHDQACTTIAFSSLRRTPSVQQIPSATVPPTPTIALTAVSQSAARMAMNRRCRALSGPELWQCFLPKVRVSDCCLDKLRGAAFTHVSRAWSCVDHVR